MSKRKNKQKDARTSKKGVDWSNGYIKKSTKSSTVYVPVTTKTYMIFKLLVHGFYNESIRKKTGYKSHSSVSDHIKKLLELGVIKCINPTEKVKFYEATPGIKVILAGKDKEIRLMLKDTGRVPEKDLVVKIRYRDKTTGRYIKSRRKKVDHKRSYKTTAIVGGKRQKLVRVHGKSFIMPVTGGPIEEVKWDKVSSPNNRFKQYSLSWPVPNVGTCTFKWNKSKSKSNLIIFLPERYLLPYELEREDEIMKDYAWKVASWFSKNALAFKSKNQKKCGIGLGILREYPREQYATGASYIQKDYLKKHGMIKTDTAGGKAWLDDSKKDGGEVEFTDRDEILIYLNLPGEVKKNRDRISSCENKHIRIVEKVRIQKKAQDMKWRDYMKLESKKSDDLKRFTDSQFLLWQDQFKFNYEIVNRFNFEIKKNNKSGGSFFEN